MEKTNEKHENLTETDEESIGISETAAESQPQDTKSRITSDALSRKEQQGTVPSREESSQRTDTIANNASKAGEDVPIGTKKRAILPAWEPDVEDDLATLCTPAASVALAQEQSWQTQKLRRKKLGKLVGAKRVRKQVFYLGGISLECSAEDISSFCGDHCNLIDCRIIPSRRHGTQATRIVVGESEGKVLESLTWPKHLYLRR